MEDEIFDASASLVGPMAQAEAAAPIDEPPDEPVAAPLNEAAAAALDEPDCGSAAPKPRPIALPETAAATVVTPNGGWRKRQRQRALPLRAGH